jgi:predicted RNase H-like HicB family nuclease
MQTETEQPQEMPLRAGNSAWPIGINGLKNGRYTMSTVIYNGYMARIEPDLDDGILVGSVVNTRDIISFHGESIAEAVESFHAAADEYLDDCKWLGKIPNR